MCGICGELRFDGRPVAAADLVGMREQLHHRGPDSDGVFVDALADGQLEVNLLDLGVSAEDIAAMRRIDARIEEARRVQQQALESGPSEPQVMTRAKGKQTMLTDVERQEQYNKLREEELRCKAMQREAPCPAAAAREIAGTPTTITAEGDERGQPATTRTTKVPPKTRVGRRDL